MGVIRETLYKSGAQLKNLKARGDRTDATLVSVEARLESLTEHTKFLSDILCNTTLSHHKLEQKVSSLAGDTPDQDEEEVYAYPSLSYTHIITSVAGEGDSCGPFKASMWHAGNRLLLARKQGVG